MCIFSIGLLFVAITASEVRSSPALSVSGGPMPLAAANVTWTRSGSVDNPPNLSDHSVAYDSRSDRIILFGGFTTRPSAETWAYDANTDSWTNMTPAFSPPARSLAAMAYDSESDRVILFSGAQQGSEIDDTWSYDYNANNWTNLNPPSRPIGRTGHAMAYDEQSDRVILFGGYIGGSTGDTWAYDYNANNWTRMDPPLAPSTRGLHGMAYDRKEDRIILFGGSAEASGQSITFFAETWAYDYDANRWTRMFPVAFPSARAWPGLAYDDAQNQTVLFGGLDVNGSNGETWFYNFSGNKWTPAAPIVSPAPRAGHAVAYDRESDRVVSTGGRTRTGATAETWLLGPAPPDVTSPTLVVQAPTEGAILGSSSVFVQGTATDDREVARVEVRTDASDWSPATGTTAWTAVVTLPSGSQSIHVRATDTSGNAEAETIRVTIVPMSTVLLAVTSVSVSLVTLWFFLYVRSKRKKDPLRRYR